MVTSKILDKRLSEVRIDQSYVEEREKRKGKAWLNHMGFPWARELLEAVSLLRPCTPSLGESWLHPCVGDCISSGCSPGVSSSASGHTVVHSSVRVTLDRLSGPRARTHMSVCVTISLTISVNTGNLQCVGLSLLQYLSRWPTHLCLLHSSDTGWTPVLVALSVQGTLIKLSRFQRLEVGRSILL